MLVFLMPEFSKGGIEESEYIARSEMRTIRATGSRSTVFWNLWTKYWCVGDRFLSPAQPTRKTVLKGMVFLLLLCGVKKVPNGTFVRNRKTECCEEVWRTNESGSRKIFRENLFVTDSSHPHKRRPVCESWQVFFCVEDLDKNQKEFHVYSFTYPLGYVNIRACNQIHKN